MFVTCLFFSPSKHTLGYVSVASFLDFAVTQKLIIQFGLRRPIRQCRNNIFLPLHNFVKVAQFIIAVSTTYHLGIPVTLVHSDWPVL
jgi:hypothetical protein